MDIINNQVSHTSSMLQKKQKKVNIFLEKLEK